MWWSYFDTQFSTCIKFSMFFQFSLDFLFAGYKFMFAFLSISRIHFAISCTSGYSSKQAISILLEFFLSNGKTNASHTRPASILHPIAFSFVQLLHQHILKNKKSRNKTVTYQHNHFINFIFIINAN